MKKKLRIENLKHDTSEELVKSKSSENFVEKCGVCGQRRPDNWSSMKDKNRKKQASYTRKERTTSKKIPLN